MSMYTQCNTSHLREVRRVCPTKDVPALEILCWKKIRTLVAVCLPGGECQWVMTNEQRNPALDMPAAFSAL